MGVMRLAITAAFVITATVAAQQPEGSWGRELYRRPVGSVSLPWGEVGMTGDCSGFVVASGVLSQADHEAAEGYGNVNEFGFSMRPESMWYRRVLELRGLPVEVVFRPIKPRELERIR
jgi:hypothetical protein